MNDDYFLQIYFIFARFCEIQKLFKKINAKELLKEGSKDTDVNEGRFVLNINTLNISCSDNTMVLSARRGVSACMYFLVSCVLGIRFQNYATKTKITRVDMSVKFDYSRITCSF
jgi:hypothetical protein